MICNNASYNQVTFIIMPFSILNSAQTFPLSTILLPQATLSSIVTLYQKLLQSISPMCLEEVTGGSLILFSVVAPFILTMVVILPDPIV